MISISRNDVTTLLWLKFTQSFLKLDRFINIRKITYIAIKRSSLPKRISKFAPKKFYEIYPWIKVIFLQTHKNLDS